MEPQREPNRAFRLLAEGVKSFVDESLSVWLERRVKRAATYHAEVAVHAEAVRDLALRGGKRLRPVLLAVGHAAFSGHTFAPVAGARTLGPGLVSLELLQAYLLIHDDWMDGDTVRRGGPTAHAALATRFGSPGAGATAAILAGDLACAYALEALMECDVDPKSLAEAARELAEMHHRVVLGQALDVRGVCRTTDDVERMHDLKTGSYTVRGPLRIGAALAGADEKARAVLEAFATPIGVAFQLRDDLLGIFGDPAVTGKPRGSDLREGKRTALTARLAKDETWSTKLASAKTMNAAELERLVAEIEKTGVKAEVEERIAVLAKAARASLDAMPALGRDLLSGAASALTRREL